MRVGIRQLKNVPNFIVRKLYLSSDFVMKPKSTTSVISDLFIWRSNKLWKTHFELLDIYGLIACDLPNSPKRVTTIIFFNKDGQFLFKRIIEGNDFARNTLYIDKLLQESNIPDKKLGEYGTFAIFHFLDESIGSDSLLTDRGYCGYEFDNSHFRGYVHGNFDAVAYSEQEIKFLMGYGKINRPYNLQHILTGPSTYDIALVNPTDVAQKIKIVLNKNGEKTQVNNILPSGGLSITNIPLLKSESARIKIISKMYMARPSVFRYTNDSMDVFHG